MGTIGLGTPWWPEGTFLRLCGRQSLHPYSLLPLLPGQIRPALWSNGQPLPVPFPFSLTGIFPNTSFAHLIPFCPLLTTQEKTLYMDITMVIRYYFSGWIIWAVLTVLTITRVTTSQQLINNMLWISPKSILISEKIINRRVVNKKKTLWRIFGKVGRQKSNSNLRNHY